LRAFKCGTSLAPTQGTTLSEQPDKPDKMKNNKAHVTIENVELLASKIAAAYGIPMQDARDLAEFNLNFADSYAAAESRIAA